MRSNRATIGLHPLWMDTDPNGGIATYWSCLTEHLAAIDQRHDYLIYYPDEEAKRRGAHLPAQFRSRVLSPASRWVSLPFSLPLELLRRPVQLLHVQSLAPPVCPAPFVQTINDLAWILHPEVFPALLRLRMELMCRRSARKARKVITVSEFSKKQLIEHYGLPPEKIAVTHHGVNNVYRVVEDRAAVSAVRGRYAIHGPFILYVGKLQARKNLTRLVKAYDILRREFGLTHKLVFIGKRTYLSDDIFATIQDLGLQREVVVLGEVPLAHLPLLHSASDLFVFPSLSEGFGLPPLEAMACGSPVVTSNSTSLPEVVGDAAIMVEPCDVGALAKAMRDVLTNSELRNSLIRRGLKRVELFSNRRMAEATLAVYDEVLAGLPIHTPMLSLEKE